ncbi:MAG: hypothetical protein NAOJABEB_00761 [Steroidobacteraceae bacterium]|nr:hypothetical protein [Steroidobacteraceae bacterium]
MHPFADLIGFRIDAQAAGKSSLSLEVAPRHMNPHGVVHGAVLYALADTAMGAALYTSLATGEQCATIEIKISYFKPVVSGTVSCEGEVVYRGRAVANLDARIFLGTVLVARANGSFAIFRRASEA